MDDDEDPMPGFELVMPFVVCASNGGPFDDDAFTAGWAAADFDHLLSQLVVPGVGGLTWAIAQRSDLVPQLDLIAMKRGSKLTATPCEGMPEWSRISLDRGD